MVKQISLLACSFVLTATVTNGQNSWERRGDTYASPASAMRPLDAPSIVDRYQPRGFSNYPPTSPPSLNPYPVRQTAYQVTGDNTFVPQPQSSLYQQNPGFTDPSAPVAAPPAIQNPIATGAQPIISPQPTAAIGTSPAVSQAPAWNAGGHWDCGPYAQTSATFAEPYTPPAVSTQPIYTPGQVTYAPNNAGYRPVLSLGYPYPNVQVGRGIIGQPTVYVPGQPVRNFFRYIFP